MRIKISDEIKVVNKKNQLFKNIFFKVVKEELFKVLIDYVRTNIGIKKVNI